MFEIDELHQLLNIYSQRNYGLGSKSSAPSSVPTQHFLWPVILQPGGRTTLEGRSCAPMRLGLSSETLNYLQGHWISLYWDLVPRRTSFMLSSKTMGKSTLLMPCGELHVSPPSSSWTVAFPLVLEMSCLEVVSLPGNMSCYLMGKAPSWCWIC